jgi:hypothetical protein
MGQLVVVRRNIRPPAFTSNLVSSNLSTHMDVLVSAPETGRFVQSLRGA